MFSLELIGNETRLSKTAKYLCLTFKEN